MRWISIILTMVLLAGLYAQTSTFPQPEDAAGFHQRAKSLIDTVPANIGEWEGVKVDVPPAAQKLLRPNAMLSRSYRRSSPDRTVSLIVVQCLDSRDMQGHYPPNCYPAHGWESQGPAQFFQCRIKSRVIPVMRYEFRQNAFDRQRHIVAYNFFVVPGKGPVADMDAVRSVAADYRMRHFGSAQIQLVMDADEFAGDTADELEVFAQLMEPILPLIEPLSAAESNIPGKAGVLLRGAR